MPGFGRDFLMQKQTSLGGRLKTSATRQNRARATEVEELQTVGAARAPARFRAFPDDAGIALEGGKPFASVGPILKLLDSHVVARLAAGTAGEERPRNVDHVRRAPALVEERCAAPGAEASR